MSYYERANITQLDGTRVFQNAADKSSEENVAARLASIWGCELRRFGALSPVDWYALRYERVVGVLELKTRNHEFSKYPTVFLNVRKWLALNLASIGLGVPALFVVQFADVLTWIPVAEIDARCLRVAGCAKIVKSDNDIEPVIDVDTASLRRIEMSGDLGCSS